VFFYRWSDYLQGGTGTIYQEKAEVLMKEFENQTIP